MSVEAQDLKRAVGICEFCGSKSLQGHRYALFASVPASTSEDKQLRDFCNAYAYRKWEALHAFQQFDPVTNAALIFAIECPECPKDKLLDMVFVKTPVELYQASSGEDRIAAVEEDAAQVQKLLAQSQWKYF